LGGIKMYNVYVAASTQSKNIGVGQYGNEQDRQMQLADRTKFWLETQGQFNVFRNKPGWTIYQTIEDCNSKNCVLFVDFHSDAGSIEQKAGDGGAEGTTVFYYHQGGKTCDSYRLASLLYSRIAPLSPGRDRGILPDNTYVSGLYVIQNSKPPAALVEHMFHTNYQEVADIIANMDNYAKADAMSICEYCGVKWLEPKEKIQTIESLVTEMVTDGIITDKKLWMDVLRGKVPANPEFLQVLFTRAVNKI
jgi:hypothetical protein